MNTSATHRQGAELAVTRDDRPCPACGVAGHMPGACGLPLPRATPDPPRRADGQWGERQEPAA